MCKVTRGSLKRFPFYNNFFNEKMLTISQHTFKIVDFKFMPEF